jgi:hypothetical protein
MKRSAFGRICRWHAAISMLAVVLVLVGCSKSGPSGKISSSAFDSAPADVKQLWNDGLNAWKAHRYNDAAASLIALQGKAGSLSTQQTEELNQARDEFGREAFAAANKGNPDATQAVLAMRSASGGRTGTPR